MVRKIAYILCSCAVILFSGCGGNTDSDELETNQIRVIYNVNSYGNGQAEITASFRYLSDVIDGMFPVTETVSLEGGDQLTVETAGEIRGFNREELNGSIIYTAQLDVGNDETDFVITLDRPSRADNFVSSVTLAPAMEIIQPVEGQVFSIYDSINLGWTPVIQNRYSQICIKTSCNQDVRYHDIRSCISIQETGEYFFTMAEFFDRFGSFTLSNQSSCTAEISLVRAKQGNISPRFAYTSRITSQREISKNITINLN